MRSRALIAAFSCCCCLIPSLDQAAFPQDPTQDATVHGKISVIHSSKAEHTSAEVVVWLTPKQPQPLPAPATGAMLVQKNKSFSPHVLAVLQGTEVEFPNHDPFFHNVFSIYQGKPFDLGLYESGSSKRIKFVRPGVSYIFCNIHPEMSAVVVVLTTPYFAMTAADGSYSIAHVRPGSYRLQVWYELASETELASATQELVVKSRDTSISSITLHSSDGHKDHLNKYGEAYPVGKPQSY
jgi:plastocyanin